MREGKRCDYLVFDISNLLHRTFYAQTNEDHTTIAGLACHMALTTLNKYYKQYRPKKVVMAFDRSSWRKQYTTQHPDLKPYKGNRRQDMSPSQQAKYTKFIEHLGEFEQLIIQYTTIISLVGELLEADDLIAGFVQMHQDSNIVVISADSDLAQLLQSDNIQLISPITDKPQDTLKKYDNDADYYLFHKCVRGDSTDNIQSAYPRVHSSKIKDVYENGTSGDGVKYINFMKTGWINQDNKAFVVEDMFKHNRVLIDLTYQPPHIRDAMRTTIETELNTSKKFSYFHILKFVGKYELNKIKDNIDNFVPMMSL